MSSFDEELDYYNNLFDNYQRQIERVLNASSTLHDGSIYSMISRNMQTDEEFESSRILYNDFQLQIRRLMKSCDMIHNIISRIIIQKSLVRHRELNNQSPNRLNSLRQTSGRSIIAEDNRNLFSMPTYRMSINSNVPTQNTRQNSDIFNSFFNAIFNEVSRSNGTNQQPRRPTTEQINRETRNVRYGDIINPISTQCYISFENFNSDDIVTQINHCGHIFNRDYISRWFENSSFCPVCRYDIRGNETEDNNEGFAEVESISSNDEENNNEMPLNRLSDMLTSIFNTNGEHVNFSRIPLDPSSNYIVYSSEFTINPNNPRNIN
jgi:hypothetical protein